MATYINITVDPNQLIQNSKQAQRSNRLSQSQKEVDQQYLNDIKRIEEAAARQQQAEQSRAVPEYQSQRYTSAQRGGFGMGWVYDSYEDVIEQTYFSGKNKYRVAVGSGDGTSWKYTDTEIDVPLNARDRILESGSAGVYTATIYRDNFTNYLECFGTTAPETITRQYEYEHIFTPGVPLYGSFVIPISEDTALLVGSVCLRWLIYKRVILASQTLSVTAPYQYGTAGTTNVIIDTSTFGTKTIIDGGGSPTGATVQASCFYSRTSGGNFDYLFNPPPWEIIDSKVTRTNYAFLITANRVTKISVSTALASLLEEIFETPEPVQVGNTFGWTVNFWPDTDYSALGVGFNISNNWGSTITGAPSIFDILDADNNFDLFKDAETPTTNYSPNPPRYAPDCILDPGQPLSTEVPNIYSAFYFGARLTTSPIVPPPPPSFIGTPAALNEYVYLTAEQRANSHYYQYSTNKPIIDRLAANPTLAFMIIQQPNPGISNVSTGANVKWQPSLGFSRRSNLRFDLKPSRVLPPALFNPNLTPHPLIRKQAINRAPSFIDGAGDPFSSFRLSTLYWTAWGRNWSAKLNQLGITLAPYIE